MIQSLVLHTINRNKAREKQRRKTLQSKQEEEPKQKQVKKKSESAATAMKKKTGKQRRAIQTKEDAEELDQEYRLLKKLKRGLIDDDEFDKLTGFREVEEESLSEIVSKPSDAEARAASKRSRMKTKQRENARRPGRSNNKNAKRGSILRSKSKKVRRV